MTAGLWFIGAVECALIAFGMYDLPLHLRVAAVALFMVCLARAVRAFKSAR